jgi:hypothetical protein
MKNFGKQFGVAEVQRIKIRQQNFVDFLDGSAHGSPAVSGSVNRSGDL